MNGILCDTTVTVAMAAGREGQMAELVRGREEALLEWVKPLLLNQSVTLDMRRVERIDAAGIAALITLYCTAREAGHRFTVSHATPRVEEILGLVGVNRLLASQNADENSQSGLCLELSAA
ncbi:MAG: STAS domain-containing protein [Terracidiphilus sp.]